MGRTWLSKLEFSSILSFGTYPTALTLGPLNILIGPNGAGKSNVLELLRLLRSAPTDLSRPVRTEGVEEWLWKGSDPDPGAWIEAVINSDAGVQELDHEVRFYQVGGRFDLTYEAIDAQWIGEGARKQRVYLYENGHAELRSSYGREIGSTFSVLGARKFGPGELRPDRSVLSQRKEPDLYPELALLSEFYQQVRLYTEWNVGRGSLMRQPQAPDTEGGFLLEDASNLAMVLSEAHRHPKMLDQVSYYLGKFFEPTEQIYTAVTGGRLQVYLRERGLHGPIPASRLSDGTLRFLCLLVILCHPDPPPLIAIEEPELGLHPDIIPTIAELLLDASQRTQLIVTTHSDLLVSQFSEQPECVVVCDRGPDGTNFRRLKAGKLGDSELPLGDRWLLGQIGGTRW